MADIQYLEMDGVPIDLNELRMRKFQARRHAWFTAKNMIEPLVEQHGLENLRTVSAPMFSSSPVVGKVQQHNDLILEVADWLLGEDR